MSTILECRGITKRFGGIVALQNVDFEVRSGQIVGLVGPNGSGKTTLLSCIAGSLQLTAGEIHFAGNNITKQKPHRRAHAGIARTFQVPRPLPSFNVVENVAVSAMFGRDAMPKASAVLRAREVLDQVGLGSHADSSVASLTLHERKFLEIARALALDPKLILLDEVLGGLNPSEAAEGMALIASLREAGVSVVYIEHNVKAVSSLADYMYVLNQGGNLAQGAPAEVLSDQRVIDAYLGGAAHA
ncbi:ABC transporter ATP-binding protein [Leucobacter sp. UT-8R-CII-1-4]|uniref:ABC transporter ATP-binding protein n=1 Tax=Leucobacter sp. UT-8R-CII-1-4 TaxID=3040075 RepID=UPI0024A87DB5|nr:ABC transporter ATP-binding protein [Leucobacter sp. UT-8R-CII-1-4]MDI6022351.1 ABC transporter ATP-binding protein [Leucobacter sp. UT-8R-CII-1-4]